MLSTSLLVSFHDHAQDEVFHQGLCDVVHCLVSEHPGVKCTEYLWCRKNVVDDFCIDGNNKAATDTPIQPEDEELVEKIWVEVTENLNSLEKIREREHSAMKTARGPRKTPGHEALNDELLCPFVKALDSPFDVRRCVENVTKDLLVTDDALHRLEHALKVVHRGRIHADRHRGVQLEGKGMDMLVDALALL